MNPPQNLVSYAELARFFLRFSLQAFGGPAAHIAMGEDEIVTRRGWLTQNISSIWWPPPISSQAQTPPKS
jgi:hypothetical protein